MTRTKERVPPQATPSGNVAADTAAPPCQEGSRADGVEPHEPQPVVTETRTLRVPVIRRHDTLRPRWTEFCAAVTALAEQIPPGVDPEISVRTITVSWVEPPRG